jgi:tRNA threonylcarbamoyladenosine biosynthesis protein TsaE
LPQPLFSIQYSLATLHDAVQQFWNQAKQYNIFAFEGEMGAGKTTFIHTLCEMLNVQDAVSSPTFALINEYHFKNEAGKDQLIFHMDWYRVKDEEEAIQAGMEDALKHNDALCFVEWAEKATPLLPRPYLNIKIDTTGITERKLTSSVVE